MRYCFLLIILLFCFRAISQSSSDSTFVRLNIYSLLEANHKPMVDVLVKVTLDIYPFAISGYTNQNGYASFEIPIKANCVYVSTYKEPHCSVIYGSRIDTIKLSSKNNISDTLTMWSLLEEIAVIYPVFYFEKNSSALNIRTYNNAPDESLQRNTVLKKLALCGLRIISYSDCQEKDSHELADKRAKAFVEYLKKKNIPTSNVEIEIRSSLGCGCDKKEKCDELDRSANRKIKIVQLHRD